MNETRPLEPVALRSPQELLPFLPWLALVGLMLGLGTAYLLGWLPHDGTIQAGKSSDWDWHLTEVEACARQWSQGWLPVWNPWTNGGIPLLSSPEVPAFYPLSWAAAVIGTVPAVRLGLVVHLALLVVGVGSLCFVLGGSKKGALVAIVGICTSDFLLVRVGHGHFIHLTLAWLPFALLGVAGRWRPDLSGLLVGMGVGAACLGGGPYPTWMALGCFVAWCVARLLRGRGVLGPLCALLGTWVLLLGVSPWIAGPAGLLSAGAVVARNRRVDEVGEAPEPVGPVLRTFGWGVVFTALLAAPKWLPAAIATHDSPRLARLVGFDPISGRSLDVWTVFRSVFLHSQEYFPVGGMEGMHEAFPSWFTPLFLLLGVAGALAVRRSRSELVTVTLLTIAVSLSFNLPVDLFALATAIPPFDRFNEPQRWGMVWVPMLSILAGLGFDAVTRGRWRHARLALLGLLVAAHFGYGMLCVQHRGRIAWPTGGSYERIEPLPPTAVAGGALGNLESLRTNIDCLDCGDPLGQMPAPELFPLRDDELQLPAEDWELVLVQRQGPDGEVAELPSAVQPWRIVPTPQEFDWTPARVRFIAASAGPHSLPITARRGWTARVVGGPQLNLGPTTAGIEELQGSAALMVVQGVEPGMEVEVRYRAPGLRAAVIAFLLGLALMFRTLRRKRI